MLILMSTAFATGSNLNDTRDVLRETCKSHGLTPHDPGTGMVGIDEKTGQMFNAWILRQNDLKEGAAK